jgi:hypothetical protein
MKILFALSLVLLSAPALADWNADIKSACGGIAADLAKIQMVAGVSTGVSAGGFLAGGAAVATGVLKYKTDEAIKDLDIVVPDLTMGQVQQMTSSRRLEYLKDTIEPTWEKYENNVNELLAAQTKSQLYGNVRTVGLGVAAGTGAVSAVSSGLGAKQVGDFDLAAKTDDCNAAIDNLSRERLAMNLNGESTDAIDQIIAACKKYDADNMDKIQKLMAMSAVVSGIGGAAALAGTIASAVATGREKQGASATGQSGVKSTKDLNMFSNVAAGVATGTSGGAVGLGAVVLAKLSKDAAQAAACEAALGKINN